MSSEDGPGSTCPPPHSIPDRTRTYPVVMLPTTSTWNLSRSSAAKEIPVAPMSCGERIELGEGGSGSILREKRKPLWGTKSLRSEKLWIDHLRKEINCQGW